MKKRIITAVVCIPVLIGICVWAPLWVFGTLVGVICAVAAMEFVRCLYPSFPKRVVFWPMLIAFIMPFWLSVRGEGASLYTLGYWLFFALFVEMILSFRAGKQRLDMGLITAGLTSGMVMPILLSALVRIGLRGALGRVNMMFPFVIAFSCDTGAYFVGSTMGKHKMTPHLSPNKTWEGAVGGVLGGVIACLLYGLILLACGYHVRFLMLPLYGVAGSIACQLGDLAFSAGKRIGGIKDYGRIIPGHGGALDRFDSMYFTAPLLEVLTFWLPAIL